VVRRSRKSINIHRPAGRKNARSCRRPGVGQSGAWPTGKASAFPRKRLTQLRQTYPRKRALMPRTGSPSRIWREMLAMTWCGLLSWLTIAGLRGAHGADLLVLRFARAELVH
jgi:hypothetical protein